MKTLVIIDYALDKERFLFKEVFADSLRWLDGFDVSDKKGNTEAARLIIADGSTDLNLLAKDGSTALMLAANKGHSEAVRLMIADDRTDLNLATKDGSTAVMLAANQGHHYVVKLLVENGADISSLNKRGQTAFDVTSKTNSKIIQLLSLSGDVNHELR